jgi:hypothetical protein
MKDLKVETVAGKENLTDEQKKAIKDGDAIAVKVHRPTFSSRFYTIALATLVFMLLAPIWEASISLLMYYSVLIPAIVWLTLYKMQTNVVAKLRTRFEITVKMQQLMITKLTQALDPKEVSSEKSKGTSEE